MSCYERSNLVRKNLGKRKSINQSINQILDTSVHEKRERGIITYREAMLFDEGSSSIVLFALDVSIDISFSRLIRDC